MLAVDLPPTIVNNIAYYERLAEHKTNVFSITLDYMQIADEIITYWKMDHTTFCKFKLTINF